MYEQQEPNGSFKSSQISPLASNTIESRHGVEVNSLSADAPHSLSNCLNGICSLDWKPSRPV
jgi:hypothetical protein